MAHSQFRMLRPEIIALLKCARAPTISRAAERLGMTQANLSKIILKLEREIGCPLFVRSRAGIRLTPEGRRALDAAERLERGEREAVSELRGLGEGVTDRLSLGAHESIAAWAFPRILPSLGAAFPNLTIETTLARSVEIEERVAQRELDAGIVVKFQKFPGLVYRVIERDALAIYAGPTGASAPDTLLYSPDTLLAERYLRPYANARRIPLASYPIIAETVAAGGGRLIGLLPASTARRHGLKRISDELHRVEVAAIFSADAFRSNRHRPVLRELLRAAADPG